MIYVGIDVSKDKHDCCILSSDGQVLLKPFSILNNLDGFNCLYSAICSYEENPDKIKVGLEATGHYSFNILGYLLDKNLNCFLFNPLHSNLFRKSLTLRKTKTDKVDSVIIAKMLLSEVDSKPYYVLPFGFWVVSDFSLPSRQENIAYMFQNKDFNAIFSCCFTNFYNTDLLNP